MHSSSDLAVLTRGISLEEAASKTAGRLRGTNAVVIASNHEPSKLVAFRLGNAGGIVVGYGEGEMLLAATSPLCWTTLIGLSISPAGTGVHHAG